MTEIRVGGGDTEARINPDDQYDNASERAECNDFIFQKFFSWTGIDGTFSTWRERHIFLRGFHNGFGTKLTDKFSDCPSMWLDEAQYYEGGQEFGYVARNALIFALTGSAATEIALNSNTIFSIITKIFGWL
jgi:hypothetical protein